MKKWSRSHVEAGKLADLFLVFPARLETWPKVFHLYSFIKHSKNEAFKHFLVNFVKRLPWKRWPLQKFRLQFRLCIPSSMTVQSFIAIKWQEKKLSMIKIFKIFVSDHLKKLSREDYAKDGGSGEVEVLCSFYHEPLRTWIKTKVNKFAISSHTDFKLHKQAPRSFLKLTCEYELHILPNTKVYCRKG